MGGDILDAASSRKAGASMRFLPRGLPEALEGLKLVPSIPLEGSWQGGHRSMSQGSSVEFSEYRDYAVGDPISLIDWAVYARTDRYVVRRHLKEIRVTGQILLDVSESMDYSSSEGPTKFQYAQSICAALALVLLRQNDSVALSAFSDGLVSRGETAWGVNSLDRALATIDLAASGRTDFEKAALDAASQTKTKSMFVVVSDLLWPAACLAKGLSLLHHAGHEILVIRILDPAEATFPFEGPAEFVEAETGRRMSIHCDEIRGRYASAFNLHADQCRRACLDASAAFHEAHTHAPPPELLHAVCRR